MNEPNPRELTIDEYVWYRGRVCQVETSTPQGLYLIRDIKRTFRTWWVRPDNVMPCVYGPLVNGEVTKDV